MSWLEFLFGKISVSSGRNRAHWYAFIVRCSDASLYTGVTQDLESEMRRLNSGSGSAYVRHRTPAYLVHYEEFMNERDARRRAEAVRHFPRPRKEHLLCSAV